MANTNPLEALGELVLEDLKVKLKAKTISHQELKLAYDILKDANVKLDGSSKKAADLKAAVEDHDFPLRFPTDLEDTGT